MIWSRVSPELAEVEAELVSCTYVMRFINFDLPFATEAEEYLQHILLLLFGIFIILFYQ
jgi:hypothetical protein